jgi:NADH-quinone oxidoreductase subunit C
MNRNHNLAALLESLPQVIQLQLASREAQGFDFRVWLHPNGIVELARPLKDLGFFLEYLTAVDHGESMELVYSFSKWITPLRVHAVCPVWPPEATPSLTGIFPAANWQEREVFDMFGLHFKGHPNLKRLLLVEEEGLHPLRKDFVPGPQHSGDSVETEMV